MPDSGFEKTEDATPRRREESRNDGNVARSADLSAACILIAALLLLNSFGLKLLAGVKVLIETMLTSALAANPTQPDDLGAAGSYAIKILTASTAPVILGVAAIALIASIAQVGFLVTLKPLQPNFGRMSPLKGLKGLFDARAGMRLVMSLGKIAVIASIAIWAVMGDIPKLVFLSQLEAMPMLAAAAGIVYSLAFKLAIGLLILALLDYSFQKWQHERDMRMTKQEVKEEMKRMDGDPLVKQRRSRVAKQLALQRINQSVPQADVIVTNPTHFAVALKYDSDNMAAPKVVAKGADFMAMRIRQVAALHGVPIVERPEIARALYRMVEVGQQIPAELFGAVAEILAYVYRLSGRRSA